METTTRCDDAGALRRHRTFPALPLLLLTASLFSQTAQAETSRYRSVVVILLDSLRPDHLQTYGYARATTPNVLAFSRAATVFLQAYSAASWTRPSIASIFTGRYSSELTTNILGSARLKDGHPTLATMFKSYGYDTAAFYNTAQLTPALSNLQAGFDAYIDYGETSGKDLVKAKVGDGIDRTISFLKSSNGRAFVFLHLLDPHHPYVPQQNHFGNTPTTKYLDSYSFSTGVPPKDEKHIVGCYMAKDLSTIPEMVELYDSEIEEADAQLARLFRFIDNDDRYKDAIVVITADHGEEFGEHGGLFHGARFYEETVRVPLIMRDPVRRYSAGRRVNAVVSLVDLAPTLLSLVGIGYRSADLSGRSLLPYFTRRGGPDRDTVFVEKIGCGYDATMAVRKGEWKMIIRLTHPKIELYNLRSDPAEKKDLATSKDRRAVAARAELYSLFEEWNRRVTRPLATRSEDGAVPIPADLRERLKALGYLQ